MFSPRPTEDDPEGQMILWRKSMFKIVEHHDILMNFDRFNSLYKNNQVCPVVVLRLLPKDKPGAKQTYFIVGSAHISYNVERGDKKLAQVSLIVSAMNELQKYLKQMGNKVVCLLCGDFNSTPSSGVYKLLTQGSYDCKSLPLGQISGQIDTIMPKDVPITEEWYKETMNKCSHWILEKDKKLSTGEHVERLPLWYMTIKNTYMDYDILKRTLIAKYKVELPLIYSFYERRTAASAVEKRRIREAFANSMDEISKLESADETNPRSEMLDYVLYSPIKFQSAYSEVFKFVIEFINAHRKLKDSKHASGKAEYEPLPDLKATKAQIGPTFNDVQLDYENWEKMEKILANHTYESGYSHWVDRVLKCDYVFYAGEGLVPKKIYEIPEYKKIVELGNICPNAAVPSDHLPVAALFYYEP